MATTFQRPVNNFKSTLSAQHTSGSGTLALQTGDGALLGALASNQVYRITAVMNPGASETIVGIFEATGLSTDTLSGVTAVEGYADSTIAISTPVQVRPTAKTFTDIQTAVNALENAVITESSITGTTTISSALSSMGKYYVCSGTSANYTVTLPTIDSTYDGMTIGFRMDPALTKLVTITGTGTQTIDGTLARVLWAGETCLLEARGSKWYKLAGRTIPMACAMRLTSAQTVASSTVVAINLDSADYDNTGLMADVVGHKMTVRRSGVYNTSAVVGYSGVAGTRAVCLIGRAGSLYDIQTETVGGAGGGNPSPAAAGLWSYSAGDNPVLYAYQSGGSTPLYSNAMGSGSSCLLALVEVPSW